MIPVTRLNDTMFFLNAHQIEMVEETPDTVISLLSGKKYIVKDRAKEVLAKIIEYRKMIGGFREIPQDLETENTDG